MSDLEEPDSDDSVSVTLRDDMVNPVHNENTGSKVLAEFQTEEYGFRVVETPYEPYQLLVKMDGGGWWLGANLHEIRRDVTPSKRQQAINLGYRRVINGDFSEPD